MTAIPPSPDPEEEPPETELDPLDSPETELESISSGTDFTELDEAEEFTELDDVGRRPAVAPGTEPLLPPALAARYMRHQLYRTGAQAFVFLAELANGEQQIVRVARPGIRLAIDGVDLTRLSHPALVRVFEEGTDPATGTDYQIMEFVEGLTLAELLASGRRLDPEEIRIVLGQLHGALVNLADLQENAASRALSNGRRVPLGHGDLQPSNLIVTGLEQDARGVVAIDYGLVFPVEMTVISELRGKPMRYSPPEGYRGMRTRAWDWWSLGMMVAELLQGHHPLGDDPIDPVTTGSAVCNRWFDLDGITDERWRLLVDGLLTNDHTRRWGADEVQRWLDGESPPVWSGNGPTVRTERPALWFAGTEFRSDPRRLADALGSNWAEAARVLGSPASRREIAEWARQFGDASLVATIEAAGEEGTDLDHAVIATIGAFYRLPRTGARAGIGRSWYQNEQLTLGNMHRLCVEALAAAVQIAETVEVDEPEESEDRAEVAESPAVSHATRLVHGDLAALASEAPGSRLERVNAHFEAGRSYLLACTEDLEPPREPWEETLWEIHLLACLTGPASALALQQEADEIVLIRRDLSLHLVGSPSPAHHLVVTIRRRRTARPRGAWINLLRGRARR